MKKRIAACGMTLLLALSGLTASAKAVELIPMEDLVAALLGMTGQATWRTETVPDETAAETVPERLPRETATAEPLPADTPAPAQEWAPDEIMPSAVTEEPLPPAASEAPATLPPVMPEPADAPFSVMPEPVVTLSPVAVRTSEPDETEIASASLRPTMAPMQVYMDPETDETLPTPAQEETVTPRPTLPAMRMDTETDDPGLEPLDRGTWIEGPAKMRAGSKKYFHLKYGSEKPSRPKLTWSLDCGPDVARVYRNGQVWVLSKAAPGQVITLTCRVEGKDAQGKTWVSETSETIEITKRK